MRISLLAFVPVLTLAAIVPAAAQSGPHDALIARHASANGLPEALVRRVIMIETRGNPRLVSKGNYGLMQIRLGTAHAMGYSGSAEGLLDADTNMTFAVKYLAGAYRAAGGDMNRAVRYYQRGYYAEAKTKGFTPYQTASVSSVPMVQPSPAARVAAAHTAAAPVAAEPVAAAPVAKLPAGTVAVVEPTNEPSKEVVVPVAVPRPVRHARKVASADNNGVLSNTLTFFADHSTVPDQKKPRRRHKAVN